MDLRDYLRAARQRWWLVLCAAGLAIGAAALVTARAEPKYATTMTFFISTPHSGVTDAYQGGLFSQQRVKSYADLLTSDRLAHAIAGEHKTSLVADQIRGRISGQALPDTVLLQATVVDTSRERSRDIGHSLTRQFKRLVEALETPPGEDNPSVKVEVIAGPRLQNEPVEPRPLRNYGLGALLGLLTGLGAAVLRETLDTTIKTAEALRQIVGAPSLGTVPFDSGTRKAPLLLNGGAGSIRAEALRQLRTNLRFIGVDQPVKTIVVTSAVPGEGKSSTAANLALVIAESGSRVLLVDADLRRPRVAAYLGLEGAVGLTNILVGQVEADQVAQPWGPAGLQVLASGFIPPNPSELLGSQHMSDLLGRLHDEFDVVVIDAPPLLPVTDAAVVAARADGALLVTRHGKTTQAQVKSAVAALHAVDARVLGCVLNMAPVKGSDNYYYHGYNSGKGTGRRHRSQRSALDRATPRVIPARSVAAGTEGATAGGQVTATARFRPDSR